MKPFAALALFILLLITAAPAHGQQDREAARIRTRELLGQVLAKAGPGINVNFNRSKKETFNYVGVLRTGLVYADIYEIVISVTAHDTIDIRCYPHYKGAYINIDKARNSALLMRQLLRLSDTTFLFWGVDSSGDAFAGYTFTLESGFPEAAIRVVLRSIVNTDKFIGPMRLAIDGTPLQ